MLFDPTEPCMSACSSLQEYTVCVKNPENKIYKLFDPSLVFQRARTCRNIRFGSKNRKTKSSSFLARAEYFSELELAEIYGSGQKTEHKIIQFLTRAVYFSELALAEIYGSGQKNGKQNLRIC